MRHPATRLAIHASLGWLVLWMASSLLAVLLRGPWLLLLGRAWQTLLPAFGFVGIMIFAMNYHFLPLFAGRRLAWPKLASAQLGAANGAVVLLLTGSLLTAGPWTAVGYGLWLVSAIAFLAVLQGTFRESRGRDAPSSPDRWVDRQALPLTMATPLYLLASALVLFLHALGAPVPFLAGLHLYTAGFIALMVFGVGLHLFPRFAGVAPSRPLVLLLTATALPAPAGLAWFIAGDPLGFAAFALLFGSVAVTFLALIVEMRWRTDRRRPFYRFNLAAAIILVVGVGLGVLFALAPAFRVLGPVHALLNLFGFAGLMIFGVTHEVLPPYAWRGYPTSIRVGDLHLTGALGGLILALSEPFGLASAAALAGRALLLLVVLSYATGTLLTLRRVPGPFGTAPGP